MDAISLIAEFRDMELLHRSFIYPDKNVSTLADGVIMVEFILSRTSRMIYPSRGNP